MRGNLSIIFGENNSICFHLIENKLISEIDKYTAKLMSSEDIRRDYSAKIKEFVSGHREELEHLGDKRGRVVITYQDLKNSNRVYRLRVLYQKNRNKLEFDYVLKSVLDLLKDKKDPKLTTEVIKGNLFLFETDFAKNKMRDAENKILSAREKTYLNNILVVQIMKKTLDDLKVKDYDKAYFALRKVDSFLERKKGYITTPFLPTLKEDKVPKSSQDVKKDSNTSTRMKDRLIEQQMYDREDIEFNGVRTDNRKTVSKVQDYILTMEEFMKKRLESASGERVSLSDIALEYEEYVQEFKENKHR